MGMDGADDGSDSGSGGAGSAQPRALIHKKILDIAASNPTASTTAIADDVSGASEKLVAQVLDEYGDPADDETSGAPDGETAVADGATAVENATGETPDTGEPTEQPEPDESNTEPDEANPQESGGETVDAPSQLTERQRETLHAIRERPTATQAEIADTLGVSRATISKRVNDISGFDWQSRRAFVDRVLDEPVAGPDGPSTNGSEKGASATTVQELVERVNTLEERLAADERSQSGDDVDTELLSKALHACMDAEYISRDEELELFETVLDGA